MSNLNKVSYFRAGTYYRVAEFRPVNTAVGPDLNTILNDHTAVMRYQLMFAADEIIPEAGRANRGIRLNYAIISYFTVVIDNHISVKSAVFTDNCILTDHAPA